MPARRQRDRDPGIAIFLAQLRVGDHFTNEEGEWEIVARPVTFKQGHEVRARVQRPSEPASAKDTTWPAYERRTIQRAR